MSNDKNLTDDDRSKVSNYQLGMEIVYNMTLDEMSEYFIKKNSGIAVSAATKNNVSLPKHIQEIGLKLSRHEFFQNIAEKANATFSKNEHNKVIAWNALLACADVKVDSLKSSNIAERLRTYESDIIANADKATAMINRLADIYNSITNDKYIKRSMNANFVSILVYVLHDDSKITNEQVVKIIETIFAKGKAIPEYSITTGANSASKEKCVARYKVLLDMFNNTKENIKEENKSDSTFTEINKDIDDKAFKEFCKKHSKNVLNTKSKDCPVDFNDMTKDEKQMYYKFSEIEKNVNKVEGVIMKAFNRIEKISA